jgi:hypothetical protein
MNTWCSVFRFVFDLAPVFQTDLFGHCQRLGLWQLLQADDPTKGNVLI